MSDGFAQAFERIARDTKAEAIRRTRSGRSVSGGPLPPKRRGGPPGVSRPSRGGIFPLLRRARVSLQEEGFSLEYEALVGMFHMGTSKTAPRRVVGMSRSLRRKALRRIAREVKRASERTGALT